MTAGLLRRGVPFAQRRAAINAPTIPAAPPAEKPAEYPRWVRPRANDPSASGSREGRCAIGGRGPQRDRTARLTGAYPLT